jgi:hypothetical protein
MSSIEEKWQLGRAYLKDDEKQWLEKVIPKNQVPEEIVLIINNQISDLRTFLDTKPKTQENLIEFQAKQDKLAKILTFASLMAGFTVIVEKIGV